MITIDNLIEHVRACLSKTHTTKRCPDHGKVCLVALNTLNENVAPVCPDCLMEWLHNMFESLDRTYHILGLVIMQEKQSQWKFLPGAAKRKP